MSNSMIYEWVEVIFWVAGAAGVMLVFGCIVGSMIRYGGSNGK